jgi:hypothetical protein
MDPKTQETLAQVRDVVETEMRLVKLRSLMGKDAEPVKRLEADYEEKMKTLNGNLQALSFLNQMSKRVKAEHQRREELSETFLGRLLKILDQILTHRPTRYSQATHTHADIIGNDIHNAVFQKLIDSILDGRDREAVSALHTIVVFSLDELATTDLTELPPEEPSDSDLDG